MSFREALARHLSKQDSYDYRTGLRRIDVQPSDIGEVSVRWDEGETSNNEDYDLSPRPPSLEVEVTLVDGNRIYANPGWVIEALLKQALEIGVSE